MKRGPGLAYSVVARQNIELQLVHGRIQFSEQEDALAREVLYVDRQRTTRYIHKMNPSYYML